jgi:hypothetical protein
MSMTSVMLMTGKSAVFYDVCDRLMTGKGTV